MNAPVRPVQIVRKLRCAMYTRKFSEEGLNNSLQPQREACEFYIASQRSKGWALVRDQYDDGGISGGTLGTGPALRLIRVAVESRPRRLPSLLEHRLHSLGGRNLPVRSRPRTGHLWSLERTSVLRRLSNLRRFL